MPGWKWVGLGASLAVVIGASLDASATSPKGANQDRVVAYAKDVKPLLSKFCIGCHTGKNSPAGVDLAPAKADADLQKLGGPWERVARAVRSGHMPPSGSAQPSREQREFLATAIESIITGNCRLQDPGRVTIRRLNRTEYANTIRDLTGVEFKAAADFPSDDVGYGFDNIGDVLTISPLLLEKYLDAAEKIAETAIVLPGAKTARYEGDKLGNATGTSLTDEGGRNFFTNATSGVQHNFATAGPYRIKVTAYGTPAGNEAPKMFVGVEGHGGQTVSVSATANKPMDYEIPFEVRPGNRYVTIAFTNDFYEPNNPDPKKRDRNLIVNAIEVVGPIGATGTLSETTKRIVPTLPAPTQELVYARQYLAGFAGRAYRRPATSEELDGLMRVFKVPHANKEPFLRSMQVAVSAVLVSPQFLFRIELDPKSKESTRLLNGYEIASRLSYFLWSSMPDDDLFKAAASGSLNDPKQIEAQIDRMLKDPKAAALTTTFGDQWLQLGKLAAIVPDQKKFPEYKPAAKNLMLRETRMFFSDIVANDRSILEFLDSKYAFLNNQLGEYYGMSVEGPQMRRVELSGDRRGGLLGQAAILMLTSNPTRTSPTKRGKWILEQILGTPPPPPPPGAGDLKAKADNGATLTVRKLLEQHRSNPECASCHNLMDPLGFSLENYSAVGTWRTSDENNLPVDTAGVLPDGQKVSGLPELKRVLMAKKDAFVRSLAEKLAIFALGRGVTLRDDCAIDEIADKCKKADYRISAMIKAVATSEPFRKRKLGAQ